MRRIFLLVLSSFLLTNLYAQCDFITTAILENDYAICQSDVFDLIISNQSSPLKSGETGIWSGDAHLTIRDGLVSGLQVGENKISYTITNGECPPSEDEIIITVDEIPKKPILEDIYCNL